MPAVHLERAGTSGPCGPPGAARGEPPRTRIARAYDCGRCRHGVLRVERIARIADPRNSKAPRGRNGPLPIGPRGRTPRPDARSLGVRRTRRVVGVSEFTLTHDLHVHSTFSDDATSSLDENVRAAERVGLITLGLADHVRASTTWITERADQVAELQRLTSVRLL